MDEKSNKKIYQRWWFWFSFAILFVAIPVAVHWYQTSNDNSYYSKAAADNYVTAHYKPNLTPVPTNMTSTGTSGYSNADSAMTVAVVQSAGIISESDNGLRVFGSAELKMAIKVSGHACGINNSGTAGGTPISDGTYTKTISAPINSQAWFSIVCQNPDGSYDWANKGAFSVTVYDKSQYGIGTYPDGVKFSFLSLPQ